MTALKFDLGKTYDGFKRLNAVNNGPHHNRRSNSSQQRSDLEPYKAARIPYARNHDAAFYANYGGEHTVDISAVFPYFDADIEYWEIWNEPDLAAETPPNTVTWGGTTEQFFDLYEITAKHLKTCFPRSEDRRPRACLSGGLGGRLLKGNA